MLRTRIPFRNTDAKRADVVDPALNPSKSAMMTMRKAMQAVRNRPADSGLIGLSDFSPVYIASKPGDIISNGTNFCFPDSLIFDVPFGLRGLPRAKSMGKSPVIP